MTNDEMLEHAKSFMARIYGEPLAMEPAARDRFYERLGLLVTFISEISPALEPTGNPVADEANFQLRRLNKLVEGLEKPREPTAEPTRFTGVEDGGCLECGLNWSEHNKEDLICPTADLRKYVHDQLGFLDGGDDNKPAEKLLRVAAEILKQREPRVAPKIEPRIFRGNGPNCLGCGKALPEHMTGYYFCPDLPENRDLKAMGKDLGTYFVRVEFEDGRGFMQEWTTGWRYTNGKDGWSPLTASAIPPTWESDEDVLHSIDYIFTEGNYACDCNRTLFLGYAAQKEYEDIPHECGDTIQLKKLTAIRPDRTEVVLFDSSQAPHE